MKKIVYILQLALGLYMLSVIVNGVSKLKEIITKQIFVV